MGIIIKEVSIYLKQLCALLFRRDHIFEAVMGIIIKQGPILYEAVMGILLRDHIFETVMGIIIKEGSHVSLQLRV